MQALPSAPSFDIFCKVIDNFGDLGVAGRLARQLARSPWNAKVRLWTDDVPRLALLAPDLTRLPQVRIVHWTARSPALVPYQVVIETFACDPPAAFLQSMQTHRPLWISLDYLSAETWVPQAHLRASILTGGLRRHFFFPGFTPDTGGLMREPGLLAARDAWQTTTRRRNRLLQALGLASSDIAFIEAGARLVLLFCYPNAPIKALLHALAQGPRPALVLIASGVQPQGGDGYSPPHCEEKLRLRRIPFVPQGCFDRILWSADLNLVRGEDSMVRALWAAQPMLWQAYVQDEGAHLDKLEAWLALSPLPEATRMLMRYWNQGDGQALIPCFARHDRPALSAQWQEASRRWSESLAAQSDLLSRLMAFCAQHL